MTITASVLHKHVQTLAGEIGEIDTGDISAADNRYFQLPVCFVDRLKGLDGLRFYAAQGYLDRF